MGIHYEKTKIHWNYFLAIERDFEVISRYIEFTEENNDTFSIELAKIIMSASQEVDVIMKGICGLLGNDKVDNINHYREVIRQQIFEFVNEEVFISRYGMSSKPWLSWNQKDENPIWWRANNKIKHQRVAHFKQANLKNAFNSLGALLIANNYYYKLEKEIKSGKKAHWKDITDDLYAVNNFMKLKSEYYSEGVIFN